MIRKKKTSKKNTGEDQKFMDIAFWEKFLPDNLKKDASENYEIKKQKRRDTKTHCKK